MTAPKLTPMMERYLEVKGQNPGAILLFRMGDFYELFFEDAEIAARILGLTLTSRDKGSPNPIPMAGFPYHALENYLQKLIQSGCRAAICEQVEDPKQAKGMVKREVTRVVTPGTITDDELLDPRENNFLASVSPAETRHGKKMLGLAWLELSAGRFVATEIEPHHLRDELARLRPAECVVPEHPGRDPNLSSLGAIERMLLTERAPWCFSKPECHKLLLGHFETSTLDGFDIEADSPAVTAAGALLQYVEETQRSVLAHVTTLEPYRRGTNLLIDEATRRSLELTRTLRDGKREGTLLSVIDETTTPMGARLLAEWLGNPLTDVDGINRRLDAVGELASDPVLCQELRSSLQTIYDLQRLTARVATGRASPRDLGSLAQTLAVLPKLKAKLTARRSDLLCDLERRLDLCDEARADIELALVDEPPLGITDGGMIRSGLNPNLDELRDLARGGKEWMARYQAQEIERTRIPNLKVGFNKVFGYYLEVTAAQAAKVPADYIRKQTLKNQERYITPELKEYEDKVLRAEERALALEQELFHALRVRVARDCGRLQRTAAALAEIDVLTGLAVLAVSRRYCRPEIVDEPILDIRDGRHPVVERLQPSGEFVPNDVVLGVEGGLRDGETEGLRDKDTERHDADDVGSNSSSLRPSISPSLNPSLSTGRMQLITGPNMAGKSTYIRQAALLTVLAQIGSFVPASSARIGIADRIFARVGASDELSKGQSTLMVEMTETARILNAATARSLVILDEIGRGTSTYDGISLAWAITEYLHDVVCCRTLFATHYHELTELTQTLPQTSNWNVAVREHGDGIVFLHRIIPGAADKSYGIQVARLAGVPRDVVDRARVILETLENDHLDASGKVKIPPRPKKRSRLRQKSLFIEESHPVVDHLRGLDLDGMSPEAALEKLHELRRAIPVDAT
ncbi:MAG: DNA mismatch repair protein MutS [Planctomycetaceae bacterium]|nr:DNA mismatch repair protein MutS [Planctomycetaceae bacterium]